MELLVSHQSVTRGETATFDIRVHNNTDDPVPLAFGEDVIDFVVEDQGRVAWRLHAHGAIPSILYLCLLGPRQSSLLGKFTRFEESWDAWSDDSGFPMPAGGYTVRGIFKAVQDPNDVLNIEVIETGPVSFAIKPTPLPDFATLIRLNLNAPNAIAAGELVSVDMTITNTGTTPVKLSFFNSFYYSNGRYVDMSPSTDYLDIAVFRDGEVIWRAVPAFVNETWKEFILAPSEPRRVSELFGTTTPWAWNQKSPAGDMAPPGNYTIRGVVTALAPDAVGGKPRAVIATTHHEMRISD